VLRGFERRLLTELGYAPLLERDAATGLPVQAAARYAYEPERGPLSAGVDRGAGEALTVSGQTLLDMARDDYARRETREEARRLMRWLIGARLGGQTLHTREVLLELQEL
jgi:DNA repair protein RecO (recombination protein O)